LLRPNIHYRLQKAYHWVLPRVTTFSLHPTNFFFFFQALNLASFYVAVQLFYSVLALSSNSFHLLLSWARVFQFGTFNQALNFLVESFGLLNQLFPLPSILEAGYPVFDLHLADVL
jgi:hypothetical protein